MKEKSEKITPLILFAILFVALVSVIAIFGGAIMKLFGFEYRTVWSIVLYFIIVSIVSFPFDFLVAAIPRVLLAYRKIKKQVAIALYLVLDIMLSYIGFSLIDYFMDSVSATDISILVLAIIFSLFGIKDVDKKLKNEE